MLAQPRTIARDTPVDDVRETFAKPSVKLLLVTDGELFVGTLAPGDVPATGTIEPAMATETPVLRPADGIPRALELLEHTSRVPVVGEDGRLHGLVCLNRSKSAFCASPLPR